MKRESKKVEKLLTNPSIMRIITVRNRHVKIKLPSIVQSTWNPGILSGLDRWSGGDESENTRCR